MVMVYVQFNYGSTALFTSLVRIIRPFQTNIEALSIRWNSDDYVSQSNVLSCKNKCL